MLEYQGFKISKDLQWPAMVRVSPAGKGGSIPTTLSGLFSTGADAKKAIDMTNSDLEKSVLLSNLATSYGEMENFDEEEKAINLALKYDSPLNYKDPKGKSTWQLAKETRNKEIKQMIKEALNRK